MPTIQQLPQASQVNPTDEVPLSQGGIMRAASVAQILAGDRIRLRVWERGAGLTAACGSGACATIVNAYRRGLTGRSATIVVDGGELDLTWRADGHVLMTGPVATAFSGEIDLSAFPP